MRHFSKPGILGSPGKFSCEGPKYMTNIMQRYGITEQDKERPRAS